MNNKLILDLISKAEGTSNNYNIAYGGRIYDLTSKTINEMLEWQKKRKFSAAGKYQIIRKTLIDLKENLALNGSELFDRDMQDRMALYLLNRRGYQKFLDGKMSVNKFAFNLAKEWASFPVPYGFYKTVKYKKIWIPKGASYYDHDGINKSRVSINEVKEILKTERILFKIDTVETKELSLFNKVKLFFRRIFNA